MLLGVKSGDRDPTVMSVRQFHTCVRRAADQVAAEKSGRRRRVANALRPDHYHSGPGPEAQRAPRALLAGVSCCSRKRAGTVAGAPRDFPTSALLPPGGLWQRRAGSRGRTGGLGSETACRVGAPARAQAAVVTQGRCRL